ncbi:LIP-domain-containing protein [Apiospora kogelbergensis]|uniref:LIP-domain-containing protein n=1 Tax=Apiospora kogelbergensis TaxID=1337665 RepID=A0AAW0RBK9_9PEZI
MTTIRRAFILAVLPLVFFGVAQALLTGGDQPDAIPPSRDPWYSAPADFASHAPGAVFRVRHAPGNISALLNNTADVYQVLYRSTNALYKPSWAVTTVFFPAQSPQPRRGTPALVSYQIPYNTLDVDYSPSYGLSTIHRDFATGAVLDGLRRGWVMNVPDFEGPMAAFSAGPQAGHAVLDAVRAVLTMDQLASHARVRIGLWGYSGGAFASGLAAERQAAYAPDLAVDGVVLGGVPSNFTQIVHGVAGTRSAAIVPFVLLGVTAQYPEARAYLVSQLRAEGPYNATTFLAALHMDGPTALGTFAGQDIFQYFAGGRAILLAPEMTRVLGNNWYMGYHGIPQMPMLVHHAIGDSLVTVATTNDYVDRLCRVGVNILYQRNTVGDHDDEYTNSYARVFEWLAQRLDSNQSRPAVGCRMENITA